MNLQDSMMTLLTLNSVIETGFLARHSCAVLVDEDGCTPCHSRCRS